MDSTAYTVHECPTPESWLAWRRMGLGATDMSVVLGVNPWKDRLTLWAEKTGKVPEPDLSDNEAVAWGKRLEPVVLEAYEERSGRGADISGECLRSVEHPWAQCTLDGRTYEHPDTDPDDPAFVETPDWVLEIKTTNAFLASAWDDGPPEVYRVQVDHQMLVTGASKATICVLIGGQQLVWCDVPRDERRIRKLIYAGQKFWGLVKNGVPPEPDGSETAVRTLNALWGTDDGETIGLNGTLQETLDELTVLKARRKVVDRDIKELENKLKMTLGPAQRGVLPSGWAVSWRTQERRGYTVAPTTQRILRLHKPKGK